MSIESDDFAIITPLSLEIENGGKKTIIIKTDGTSEEAQKKAAEAYGDLIGADSITQIDESKASSSFGFDSRKWRGSNWEPRGPQNNPDLN